MINLSELTESVLRESEAITPSDIAAEVFEQISAEDYADALEVALVYYVRDYIVKRRVTQPVPRERPDEEETFAPDDLLAPDVQEIVRVAKERRAVSRGSRKLDHYRSEWRKHMDDRVFNGREYKLFGDFTADDLRGAAAALRDQAEAFKGKAAKYDELAEKVGTKTLRDFEMDPTLTAVAV